MKTYLQFLDTSLNPSTEEKYNVAWSKVSATGSPPLITLSTITFGSIFKISFSCFLFCLFMSSDFLSTLKANIYRFRRFFTELILYSWYEYSILAAILIWYFKRHEFTWIEVIAFFDRSPNIGQIIKTTANVDTPHAWEMKELCSLSAVLRFTYNIFERLFYIILFLDN